MSRKRRSPVRGVNPASVRLAQELAARAILETEDASEAATVLVGAIDCFCSTVTSSRDRAAAMLHLLSEQLDELAKKKIAARRKEAAS